MKKIFTGILAIALLSGCKKGTTITYQVINNSGEQVTLTSYYSYNSKGQQSTIINNGDTREIMILSKADGGFEENYTAGSDVDSITGKSNEGKTLIRDLSKENCWRKVSNKKHNQHTFTTELTAVDFQ